MSTHPACYLDGRRMPDQITLFFTNYLLLVLFRLVNR